MSITNGYCTLNELKQHLMDVATYTASTISFTASTKKISDTAWGLKRFQTDDLIQVSGSTSNNSRFTVATGNVAAEIVTSESLTDESVGQSITITNITDLDDDALLEGVVEDVSRWIDDVTGRRFYSASETRYYTPHDATTLFVDDLLSITTLKTDSDGDRTFETTWATSDYDLLPLNAAVDSNNVKPYTRIETTPLGSYTFPLHAKGVEIVGSFGFASSAPGPVRRACLIMCERIVRRKDAPLGVAGTRDLGTLRLIAGRDPDVFNLLATYRAGRWVV